MPIELYPNIAKVKRNGVYQNLPGFVQASGDADIKAMIASSESSTTAQFYHPKGSYFILNDLLYQADENIAVNGTIAVGTNCHVSILGNGVEENTKNISDLNNSVAYDDGNLMNDSNTIAGWINPAGWRSIEIDQTKLQRLTDFIPVVVNDKYTVYSEIPSTGSINVCFTFYSQARDGNSAFVSQVIDNISQEYDNTKYCFTTVTVPENALFMRVNVNTYGLPKYYLFNTTKKETPILQALKAKYSIANIEELTKNSVIDNGIWYVNENVESNSLEKGYYYNSSKQKNAISGWGIYHFPVEKGVYSYTVISNATSGIGSVILDTNNTLTLISAGISNNVVALENKGIVKVEESSTIYITQRLEEATPIISAIRFNINSFEPIYSPDSVISGKYVNASGQLQTEGSWNTQVYNIAKNKIYRAIASVIGGSVAAIISIANNDLSNIKVIKTGNSLTTYTVHDEYVIAQEDYTKLLISAPNNSNTKYYIALSAFNLFYEDNNDATQYVAVQANSDSTHQTKADLSSLTGKTWNAVGDSITAQGLYISPVETETGLDATNLGIASSTIAVNNTYLQNQSIVEKVCGLNSVTPYEDADIWTIFGGLNDQLYNSPLGDIYSTDPSTVYGALKAICDNIRKRTNNPLLILVTPTQSTRNGEYMMKLRKAIIDVGLLYACPVIDAYAYAGINPANIRNVTSDGVHINDAGAKFLYPLFVAAFNQYS